jgi:hypothetical protein
MTPTEFLQLLWRQKPESLNILIWKLEGKESRWFQDIASAAAFVDSAKSDVYVGVGLSHSDYGPHQRCRSDAAAGIAGLWADFDLRSPAHPDKALPATIEDALSIIPPEFPPTIVIFTGNGIHAWWLFEEPWVFQSAEERNEAAVLSSRFQTLLRYNASQRGWKFDRLSDLARVLRIPGTLNAKDPLNPKAVELYSAGSRPYKVADIREHLDVLAIPDPESIQAGTEATAQRFADMPLAINLQASVSDSMLASWMARDQRFENTWTRQRRDMADQSGSGYDMALACFGINAGLSDQQIVDLIVHHRRIHGDRQNKRPDYYQRTISKARKKDEPGVIGEPLTPPLPSLGCVAGGDAVARLEDRCAGTRRATLCEQISSLLRVHLLRLIKVPGKEPVYLMELEEGRIEFDIAKLTSQKAVKLALAARAGKIIPTFKTMRWQELTQMMLDACTVVENTDDLEYEGAARMQIDKYLSENACISLENATGQDRHKPFVWKSEITISSLDIQEYINRTTMQNHSVQHIAAMLTALGARAVRVRSGSFKEQSRWALPVDEFPPQDYPQAYREDDPDAA